MFPISLNTVVKAKTTNTRRQLVKRYYICMKVSYEIVSICNSICHAADNVEAAI